MNTNILDPEDQNLFQGMKFLDFETVQKGVSGKDPFEGIRTNNSIRRRNPLSYSPMSKNGTNVRDNFFGESKIYNYSNFEIIVDLSSSVNPPDKIKVIESSFYWDSNNSKKFGDTINGVADKFAFTVKLFISNFENQITDAYNDPTIIPDPKEILLFLEDNTNDWSGATIYIKKGSDLKNLKFIDATMANNPRFTNYIQKSNNISLSDLKELLRTDKVENQGLNLISCLFEIASFGVTDSSLLKGVAKGIKFVNEKIKETCSFEDKSWNPAKAEANTAFEPILLSGSNKFLDELDDDKINKTVTEMIANFGKHFKEYDAKILELLNSNMGVVPLPIVLPPFMFVKTVDVIPKSFEELLLQKYKKLRVIVYDLLDQLPTFDFSDILKEGINCVNAFLCGIWNGFIEAICGIISLVQYLFEGAEFMAELLENFKEKGPQVLEKIDDIILNFQNIDFGKIFSKLANNIVDFIKNGANVSLVEIAYFCGAFVGFVVELAVEIVIGILFTGGVLTIEAVFAKIGETFKAIASLLTGAIKGLYKAGEKTLSSLLKGFDFLIEFLSKGTDEILRIIDEVFAKLKQVGEELTKKYVDDVPNFSKSELDWMAQSKETIGNLGGTILKSSQIRKLRGILKQKGITLIVEGDLKSISKLFKPITIEGIYFDKVEDLLYFMRTTKPPLVGGFDAVNMQMILPKNTTEIVVFHEMAHVKHFEQVGEVYHTLNRLQKETYVWKQIIENRGKWTKDELQDALEYINRIRVKDYNLEPLKIK